MASQQLGVLLLQGWTMLEECCDDCNVPLMRSRDKKQELCVQCNQNKLEPRKQEPAKTNESEAYARLQQEKQNILEMRRKERE